MTADAAADVSNDVRDPLFCRQSHPGDGDPCSPTSPCPDYLRCVYEPGCVDPHGTCRAWAFCPDVLVLYWGCSCDHRSVNGRDQPIEEWGDACLPEDASAD